MEEYKFELNEKFYSFDGIIGRYGYLLNLVIICAISFLVIAPYSFYTCTHAQGFMDAFGGAKVFASIPLLLKIWTILGLFGICTLSVSNVYRRLKDIFGTNTLSVGMLILIILYVMGSVSYVLMPLWVTFILGLINIPLGLVLLFKKGKFTSTMPYDFKKEFNWGACCGTWIWGLFNKSYIPLWQLLLWVTPMSFYFSMFCGLKGNGWAYENKKCDDVKKFNKSQETQAIIFVLLHFLVVPVVIILFVVVFFALVASLGISENKSVPDSIASPSAIEEVKTEEAKSISALDNFLTDLVSVYFKKYEITENENKFYVDPTDWKLSGFKEKKDMLDMAANLAAGERRKKYKPKEGEPSKYFSKTSELPRTKIYSVETGQLLGEFNLDESKMSSSFKDAFKAAMNAYKFYNIK